MTINKLIQSFVAAACVSAVAGCSTARAPAPVPSQPDPVMAQLNAKLMLKAEDSPAGPDVKAAKPVYSLMSTTVSYWGDASNLLKDVAAALQWEFKTTGPQPHLPIYVQIDVTNIQMKDFLTRVALQLSQRADVVIGQRSIELRYRAN